MMPNVVEKSNVAQRILGSIVAAAAIVIGMETMGSSPVEVSKQRAPRDAGGGLEDFSVLIKEPGTYKIEVDVVDYNSPNCGHVDVLDTTINVSSPHVPEIYRLSDETLSAVNRSLTHDITVSHVDNSGDSKVLHSDETPPFKVL